MPRNVAAPNPPYVGPAPRKGGRNNKPIRRIVIHCTAGSEPGVKGAARGTANYTKRSGTNSSYHYVADARETVQLVYDSDVAWHDGTNRNSIGYELCCSLDNEGLGHWADDDHQAMLARAAEDVARLCLAYDVPIRKLTPQQIRDGQKGLCGHVDMRSAFPGSTTHWDPGPHFPWALFIRMVQQAAATLVVEKPVIAPTLADHMTEAVRHIRNARTADAGSPWRYNVAIGLARLVPGWKDAGPKIGNGRHGKDAELRAAVKALRAAKKTVPGEKAVHYRVNLVTTALQHIGGWAESRKRARK